ncbi:MAG: LD-carboxypeptidase [Muribaculaceae bacterium]|nr:LD-carboxypeptidase [Muribaculaceae bacterium]
MNLIKPKKLKLGDTIAIIAPSGEVDIKKINRAVKYFETLGFKVKLGSNIKKQNNYLAGTDEERLEDLHAAFQDSEVKAIICARGGYGAIRLINKIDYELIKNNPKVFCGYSDITALSTIILKQTGLITFSAPMAQSDFAFDEIDEYTLNSFLKTIMLGKTELYPTKSKIINKGKAKGTLIGGNLTTLASLCGIDFIPNKKFILFAEDIDEPAYKLDRYFTQLLNIDKFRKNLAGIILGEFSGIDNQKYFDDFMTKSGLDLNIPILGNYPITHGKTKATVPIGAVAEIEKEKVQIKESMDE